MMSFLIQHRRFFSRLSLWSFAFTICMMATACAAPTWLTDATNILTVVGASFTSIASFIAGLTGNTALAALLAVVSTWIAKVQTGLSDLSTLVAQYQEAPSATLLSEIEAGLEDVTTNVQQDFSNLGLPASILSVITGIAALALNLLTEWSVAIAGVKNAATPDDFKAASATLSDLAKNLPQQVATFKAGVNGILNTPTGDAEVDAALAKATRLT
jgi:hypothetical protein